MPYALANLWMRTSMSNPRKPSRREMTRRRAAKISAARANATANCIRAASVLQKAKLILGVKDFGEILRLHGVQSLPAFLSTDPVRKDRADPVALEFAVVWTFLFPLLENPAIAGHLNKAWPGFISEFKDAFIALVLEGPFSHAKSGRPSAN
jgi:hypothetical protein